MIHNSSVTILPHLHLPGRKSDHNRHTVHVFAAPELRDEPPGILLREDDETDQGYAVRAATLRTLLGRPNPPVAAPTAAAGAEQVRPVK